MRQRARKKVFDYILLHPGSGAAQVARGLGMTAPAVRHHLAILVSDRRIEAGATSGGPGRGRPRLSYRVSEAFSGNNLAMLAEHLLDSWKDGATARRSQAALVSDLARRLSEQLKSSQQESSAGRRLSTLVGRLNELHYGAGWEAGAEGPRLLLGRCPYAAVLERHPELCQMDAQAVAAILNAKVHQTAKIDPAGGRGSHCVFSLQYL